MSPLAPGRTVADTVYRGIIALRVVTLANTVAVYAFNQHTFVRPAVGWVVLGGLGVWTAVASWAYHDPRKRTRLLLVADLAIAVGAVLLSRYVKGHVVGTLPGFWVMATVFAWAVHWGWVGGAVSSTLVIAADLYMKQHITQSTYGTSFLLVIGGPLFGFMVGLIQDMAAQRDRAERAAAAAIERQRLGRIVHDGVLQVLALVQKRGAELGGAAAELGRLAGEQEASLRAFVQRDTEPDAELIGELDLAAELSRQASTAVTISVPPDPVMLPSRTAYELAAVVAACLSNVRHHVGRDAPAWVLVEDEPTSVTVSVRDDGPGIPEGRLESAAGEGRLGVLQSIRGRIQDLGGTATLTTAPGQGTEWEFTVPRTHEHSRAQR